MCVSEGGQWRARGSQAPSFPALHNLETLDLDRHLSKFFKHSRFATVPLCNRHARPFCHAPVKQDPRKQTIQNEEKSTKIILQHFVITSLYK